MDIKYCCANSISIKIVKVSFECWAYEMSLLKTNKRFINKIYIGNRCECDCSVFTIKAALLIINYKFVSSSSCVLAVAYYVVVINFM